MTRYVITDPGTAAHSAKNAHAAPGLPNQPENHSGRTPMVGTNTPPDESGDTLAERQAAGLRTLAALIEQNPNLAQCVRFALGDMLAPLLESYGDARAWLAAFHAAARAQGAAVTVDNSAQGCHVTARFGPVALRMMGGADLMAGQPARYPSYEPLCFDETAGGER